MIFPRIERVAYMPASVPEKKCFTKIKSIVKNEVNANEKTKTGKEYFINFLKSNFPLPLVVFKKLRAKYHEYKYEREAPNKTPTTAPKTFQPIITNITPKINLKVLETIFGPTFPQNLKIPCNNDWFVIVIKLKKTTGEMIKTSDKGTCKKFARNGDIKKTITANPIPNFKTI